MKRAVIGIFAHVDAGKTTLAESILYSTGVLRSQGRVDNGNTALDTDEIEKARGITVFSSQAVFNYGGYEFTLLDTPGHVDFSCETERTLRLIDAAVLVISGTDGVKVHTVTLWNLLRLYNIPVYIFVTKMDYSVSSREEILNNLQSELSPDVIDFSDTGSEGFKERIALCSEELLDTLLSGKEFDDGDISRLILSRRIFPCLFGSGLKNEGVIAFLDLISHYSGEKNYTAEFGARVFKISRDKDSRLVHLKVTGGKLKVRDIITRNDKTAKINRIRIYTGSKYITADEAPAGTVCAVEGLDFVQSGDGLGFEEDFDGGRFEPIMRFRINLPEGCDAGLFYPKLRLLEEEEPSLKIEWNSFLQQIHVCLMGKVQAEILKSVILEKFGVDVSIDNGTVQYKETVRETVEGVGHYEPLRHYAEVHVLIEPMPRCSGTVIVSRCGEDVLDRNWQRLIMTHIAEKEHLGVLTGSPLTDVKIVLAAGRAHLKHTEGGDSGRQLTG
ncbi:MAG: TetM/TetW/TetO/TetS family tetracycline resistance ribosomal protection protein, partial [Clostridia bacterium]|nr:TetM/TetW/TetO/TetS family tetracycline resistance ribosomal protection protein [Clostridia bacterium]